MAQLIRRIAGAMIAVAALVAVLELALRLLPVPGGFYRAEPQTPLSSARQLPDREYTFSVGWDLRNVSHGRLNSMGFVSPHQYSASSPAIALFGDSFAEGLTLPYEDSPAGQIERQNSGRLPVFNFGFSGTGLPHYLGMAQEVGGRFEFRAAVVLVTPSDYRDGFSLLNGTYVWADRGDDLITLFPETMHSALVRTMRQSALIRYVRSNLRFNLQGLLAHPMANSCQNEQLSESDLRRLERYAVELPKALKLPADRIVIVFDTNRDALYRRVDRPAPTASESSCESADTKALERLKSIARERGLKVIDAGPLFEGHYREHHQQLDASPIDRHWNRLGASLIAQAVASALP